MTPRTRSTPLKKTKKAGASPRKAVTPEVLPPEDQETSGAAGVEDDRDHESEDDSDEDSDIEPDESEIADSLPATRARGAPIRYEDLDEAKETETATDTDAAAASETGRSRSAVSPNDPLRRYMEEVKRYPLLPPEEEFRLATKLRDTGDLTAAKALVSANLRLVVKIAMEYRSMHTNLLDLIQEGNIGLMKAVSKFDPTKGAKLGYYSSWWIRSYILKYLLDNFRLVKVGTTQAQKKLFYHLMREKERLEAQGLFSGPKLLAERLNVREKDVVEMEQRLSGRGAEVSLDTPIGDEDGASHGEMIPDLHEAADETLAREELLTLLKNRLPAFEKQLNDREKKLLQARLLSEDPKTLQEVADLYGLTRERARQIEAKLIQKLREFLKDGL